MTASDRDERESAINDLRKMLPPGSTVYTVLRQVSRSGMSRRIDVYAMDPHGDEPRYLTGLVSQATGFSFPRKGDGLRVGGCGMDMGFHVVYELSHVLYADGYACLGSNCPAPAHVNARTCTCGHDFYDHGDRDTFNHSGPCRECSCQGYKRHDPRGANVVHHDGGYALRQRWL